MTPLSTVLICFLNFHKEGFVLKALLVVLPVVHFGNYLRQAMRKIAPNGLGKKDSFQGQKVEHA